MSEPLPPTDARPPSLRQVALGLFILFQLGFLLLSNTLEFIRWAAPNSTETQKQVINRLTPEFANKRGHAWDWCAEFDNNLKGWGELTGQEQSWGLFSPSVGKTTGFPAVLMLWEDPDLEGPTLPAAMLAFDSGIGFSLGAEWNPGPTRLSMPAASELGIFGASNPWELTSLHAVHRFRGDMRLKRTVFLLSENESPDVHHFVRFGRPRFRRYESQLYVNPLPIEDELPESFAVRMTEEMQNLVRRHDEAVVAYLKYRTEAWRREHPGEPAPKQVVLLQRSYRIRMPQENPGGWDGPMLVPCARWHPEAKQDDGYHRMEPFDFVEQRFDRLRR